MTGVDGSRKRGPEISCLEDNPHRLADLAALYEEQWPSWYGPQGPGSAGQDLSACLDVSSTLPRCLFVDDETGTPIGTVSLRDVSPGSDLFPGAWLTALLVAPEHRGQGLGAWLIGAACGKAKALGFDILHAANSRDDGLFVRLGGQLIGQTSSGDQLLNLYRSKV